MNLILYPLAAVGAVVCGALFVAILGFAACHKIAKWKLRRDAARG